MKIIISKGQFLGPISGADEILVNYATMLHSFGHDVSVLLVFPCSPTDPYYLRLREAGVSIYTVAPSSVGTFLNGGRRLAREILAALPWSQSFVRRNAQRVAGNLASRYHNQCRDFLKQLRADVVHVLSPDPGAMIAISAAHAADIPVIYQEVGIPYHPPNFEFFYKQFSEVLPLCAEVATLSPRLAQISRETLPYSNNLSVLPITVEDLRNGHAPPRAEKTDLTIGFAARFEHLKGPSVLLKAFAAASHKCPGLRLLIAGAGSLEQQLIAMSHELGVASRCEFTSVYKTHDERQSFMERLDIFALPSLTEGTPNGIIEAMSLGVPIVASDVGGIPDMVASDAGILVSPKDSEALSRAFVRLAQDPELRRQMGSAARERYEKLFSTEAVLPVLLRTYRRVSGQEFSSAPNPDLHPWE